MVYFFIINLTINSTKTEYYHLLDFLNENKVPYVRMSINTKTGKQKNVRGIAKGWMDWSYDKCMEYNKKCDPKCNAININLYEGELVVVDVDNEDAVEEAFKKHGKAFWTKSCRRKLPHIYFKRSKTDKNTTKVDTNTGVDILYKNVFEMIDSEMFDTNENGLTEYKYETNPEKKKIKIKTVKTKKIIKSSNNKIDELVSNEEKEIIDNIHLKYIDNYGDWLKLIWGLYNHFESIEVCDYLSQRGSNYGGVNIIKEKILSDNQSNITWGTIIHYSKKSNMENYLSIRSNYNDLFGFDASDESFKDLYVKLFNNDLKKNGGNFYVFKDPYWEVCDSELLATCVSNSLLQFIDNQLKNTEEDREEKIKQLKILRKLMGSWAKMKSVGKVVMNNFQDSDIEFDNKNNYFCFKNCAIDLDTGKEVNINREDYITINTGYNKVKSTKEQRNVLEEMMSKIFPDKEELQSFYTLLKVTLYGEQDKQFHVLRGNGSNGKGLVCEHFEKVMGNYYYKPNKEFLLNKLSDGVSEILSNMDRKRLINFTELAKDDKIRPEIIKVLTDAPTTTARGIYEKSHIIHLLASIWIDTNPEIKILGDVDYSIERRFVYWYFRSTFVDNEKYLTRADNIYMKESKFKDTTFVRNNRSTWIDLILEKTQGIRNIQLCDSIIANTKKALNNMDDVLDFVEPRYERTGNEKDYIQLKDMYTQFRDTEEFCDMTKEEKRKWSKKNFGESIQKNINFMGDFRERIKRDGATIRSVFLNWKEKQK